MTLTDRMEEMSRNFILTIAHNRGFFPYNGRDYGTDMQIRKSNRRINNGRSRYLSSGKGIDIQLKSVLERNVVYSEGAVKFKLEAKNYNDLVERANENGSFIPLVLVVYIIPDDEDTWIECCDLGTVMKKEGYWYILPQDSSATTNTSSFTIEIPIENKIDEELFPNLWSTLFK